MRYEIWLKGKNWESDPIRYKGFIEEDMITPLNLAAIRDMHAEEVLGLCKDCDMDCHCHVINLETGEKYCTILFHDRFKPKWKISRVL